jgi:hypothetical protein
MRIKDITRKISRKRSIRPVSKFVKLLPGMLPSVKGILSPARVAPSASEISTETIVMSNLSKNKKDKTKGTTSKRQRRSSWVPPAPTPRPSSLSDKGNETPAWAAPRLRSTGEGEKIHKAKDLAKPITFPVKEESSEPVYNRTALRPTEYGDTIQNGGEITSRRARRRQDLFKRFQRRMSA